MVKFNRTYSVRNALSEAERETAGRVKAELASLKGSIGELGYRLDEIDKTQINCPFDRAIQVVSSYENGIGAFRELQKTAEDVEKAILEADGILDTEYARYGQTIDKIGDGIFGSKIAKTKRKYAFELAAIPVHNLLQKISDVKMVLNATEAVANQTQKAKADFIEHARTIKERDMGELRDNNEMYAAMAKALDAAVGLSKSYTELNEARVTASRTFDPSLWDTD